MGALARKLWSAEHCVRENQWGYWHPYLPFLGDEVTGKTIAVIGTGRIGLAFIKKCAGFDMNILCYDPVYQNHQFVQRHPGSQWTCAFQRHQPGPHLDQVRDLERRCARPTSSASTCRWCVKARATLPTYHLINEKTLRMMKPTAYLINTSRGPVVDENAVARRSRKTGSPAPPSTSSRRSRCPPTRRCAIRRSRTAAASIRTSPARARSRGSPPIRTKAWPAAASRADRRVWKATTTAIPAQMPFVVNKEAFKK